jgi:hypothetical protein
MPAPIMQWSNNMATNGIHIGMQNSAPRAQGLSSAKRGHRKVYSHDQNLHSKQVRELY